MQYFRHGALLGRWPVQASTGLMLWTMKGRILSMLLRFVWGGFLLFSSIYCLLAFLPFTYSALIKAPPYDWIPWFVNHYSALYWLACGIAGVAFAPILKSK